MSSIIAGTLRQGKKARDKQGSDDHLSKVVELNGKYRLFFRTIELPDEDGNPSGERDIAVAVVPGRSLDYNVCGASFIAYDSTMCDISTDGAIQDKTGLGAWARIARVLHQAQCMREKKNAESEATRAASDLGKPVDQVKLAQALEGIELKYNGGRAADGTRIAPKLAPAISGVQQKMTTQLLVVKLLPNGAPDFANAKYAVLEISNARMNELLSLIDNPDYFDNTSDYFEVGYDYIGADKAAAGRAAKFQGIAATLQLKNQFPDEWAKHGEALVNGIAKGNTIEETAEVMKSRNRNLKVAHTPNEIISSMKKWCANNSAIFASIDYESEDTQRAAKDFITSNLLDAIPVVKEKFQNLVAEQGKEQEESAEEKPVTTPTESVAPVMPTFEQQEQSGLQQANDVINAGAASQTLAQMASAVPNIDLGDDDMGDLD